MSRSDRPSARTLERLLQYALESAECEHREHMLLLQNFISRLLEDKLNYKCESCGFTVRAMHWQCPSCKLWSKIKPIHGIEGE